ncbi:PAS domain S-box-containing protein/diguanylate cyclase (GGDEF) domain-containing protein [Marinobacter daqiaonensis]|uniref:PAS domain S-box-containing protein/diguanylate cyclase (GGDEF) domain-containing protein n=1 Tax=Marinobacter daqiaonensis TaxID=650891 RepID=A0A1I6K138_9GAMM|nr:diguanylate cyclase [Marinobacter daqiaonensis]SFR84894.1 PAS domain S-box-containing protein/diguanylate cyclase (GGDEF) domain-containing protein [Marinobacter daqiaonensis]
MGKTERNQDTQPGTAPGACSDPDRLLWDIAPATLFVDPEHRIRLFTSGCQSLFNLAESDIGRTLNEISLKADDRHLLKEVTMSLKTLAPSESEVFADNGSWYLRRIAPYRIQGERADGVAITYTDITRLKNTQDELSRMTQSLEQSVEERTREAQAHLRERERAARERDAFFELSAVPFFVMAPDGYFQRLNPAWEDLFGWKLDELYERPYLDLIHQKDLTRFKNDIKKARSQGQPVTTNARFRLRDGSYHWLEWDVQPGENQAMCGVVRKISRHGPSSRALQWAREKLEKQMPQRAGAPEAVKDQSPKTLKPLVETSITIDSRGLITSISPAVGGNNRYASVLHKDFTGLVSRTEFENRLTMAVDSARKTGKVHALLLMSLDRCRPVEETGGTAAVNELLREVAGKLQVQVRQRDTLAHLEGHEFAAILENCAEEHACRIAEDMRALTYNAPFTWNGKTYQVGMSIGIALVDAHVPSAQHAVHNANSARHIAQEDGRSKVHVFNQDTDEPHPPEKRGPPR